MKKRDIFWLNRIILILFLGITFVVLSIYNIVQFNNAYIQEEKKELDTYTKQIKWVAIPLLETQDFESLKRYASDFKGNNDFSFRIFDKNKDIITSSVSDSSDISQNDRRLSRHKYSVWDLYIDSFNDKNLEKVTEIYVGEKKYYIEISLCQEYVMSSIVKAQKNIMIFFCICLGIFILSLIHVFYIIRNAFDSLEDNIMKIANGDFEAKIDLPKIDLLYELSIAIKKMTKRLKNQIKRLTQLEKYRSDFISNISHEIKTPITALSSAVELIEAGNNSDEINQECYYIIKTQTNAINGLVHDILALSEIDLEKTNENKNFQEICLNSAIREAIDAQGVTDKNIVFSAEKEYNANANEELVITAISNLLSNAIRYSGSDKIDIELTKKGNTMIEIKDYGIGIEEQHLPRIFERFYRVDKARSRKSGGTGLGLAIVKNIAELHGWSIEVESKTDKGTTFRIIIPDKK